MDTLKDAFSDKETKPTTYTIWGVTLDPENPSAKASVVLMKFLRARYVSDASSPFLLHQKDTNCAIPSFYPHSAYFPTPHVYANFHSCIHAYGVGNPSHHYHFNAKHVLLGDVDRNLDVPSARSMLTATIRWRESFGIDKAMKEEYPADVFGELGHVYGKDKGGRPVT